LETAGLCQPYRFLPVIMMTFYMEIYQISKLVKEKAKKTNYAITCLKEQCLLCSSFCNNSEFMCLNFTRITIGFMFVLMTVYLFYNRML
jgi:hypothetical protein